MRSLNNNRVLVAQAAALMAHMPADSKALTETEFKIKALPTFKGEFYAYVEPKVKFYEKFTRKGKK